MRTRHLSSTVAVSFPLIAAGAVVACTSRNPAPATEPAPPPPEERSGTETQPEAGAPAPTKADTADARTSDAGKIAPSTLAEAHARLDEELSAEDKQKMARGTERDMIDYHHGLGTYIRNNFGLWQGGPLAQSLRKLGLSHPDDMSSVVLDSYWCHLKGRSFDVSARVAYYDAYWQGMKAAQEKAKQTGSKSISTPSLPDPAPMCPDPAPR